MTSNDTITIGDIMGVTTAHDTKRSGNTIATVVGIVGALLVIAIIIWAFFRRGEVGKNTEKETNINLGQNGEAIEDLKLQVSALTRHERDDFAKITYNDGFFRGRGYYNNGYHDHNNDGCGCGHGHNDNCKQKMVVNTPYTAGTPTANVINECFCS